MRTNRQGMRGGGEGRGTRKGGEEKEKVVRGIEWIRRRGMRGI